MGTVKSLIGTDATNEEYIKFHSRLCQHFTTIVNRWFIQLVEEAVSLANNHPSSSLIGVKP